MNCLELPADGHFAWDVRWRGLKPNLLQFVYGPTKVVPRYKTKTQRRKTVSVVSNRGHPRVFKNHAQCCTYSHPQQTNRTLVMLSPD